MENFDKKITFTEDNFKWIDKQLDFLYDLSPDIKKYTRNDNQNSGILNIFQFNDKYLHYKLFPREITALKIIYGIELNITDEEEIKWLFENKNLRILWKKEGYHEIVFVMGRKSGKSAFTAIISCYELYRIHTLFNPQDFFGFLPNSPISMVLCSASGAQAEELHLYVEAAIKNCDYFKDYIDSLGKKDISIFTQQEKRLGDTREGSLKIHTLHSLSRTVRTYNAFVVVMDELAHMIDNKGIFSGDALYKALTPSITLFKNWGRIISLSSPLGKSGKLYQLYQLSQDENIKSIVAFQYANHEFNPNIKKEDFEDEHKKDPTSADMEYNGNFGTTIDAYLPEDKIDIMFKSEISIVQIGNIYTDYIVTVDPSKNNDRYVICVMHKETRQIQGRPVIFKIIDNLKYFEAEIIKLENGDYKKLDIRVKDVEDYIINLTKRGFKIALLAYDQFHSTSSIQKFNDMGFNAIETTFTAKYKEIIYTDLKNDLINETIECYGMEKVTDGKLTSMGLAKLELKVLQRTLRGKSIHIGHPNIGPVQTDDFADVIANGCHLLTEERTQSKISTRSVRPLIAYSTLG